MPRRIISHAKDCIVCLSIDEYNLSTLKRAFLRGYVSGLHVMSKGSEANERLCQEHALDVEEALAFYRGTGVDFIPSPTRLPSGETSTRVDVSGENRAPGSIQRASGSPGPRPPKRR